MAQRGLAVDSLHWRRRSPASSLLQLRELPPRDLQARGLEERFLGEARYAFRVLPRSAAMDEGRHVSYAQESSVLNSMGPPSKPPPPKCLELGVEQLLMGWDDPEDDGTAAETRTTGRSARPRWTRACGSLDRATRPR